MPTGTPYNACIKPYRIRVDAFGATANADPEEPPRLHLLTHTHSDHIVGLSAKSFGYTVVCSDDAKQMLLKHEVYAERELQALELRAEPIRTYSHLKVEPIIHPDGSQGYYGSKDLLRPIPINVPTRFDLDAHETVMITALDANHCPGAIMYLVEGDKGAVLHTGDFRAEPWFLESITRNPILQRYLSPTLGQSSEDVPEPPTFGLSKTLETIYLDTASVFSIKSAPTKESATSGLTGLMKCFPSSVYFFINSWTWGYEDILKAIAREFQSLIHVDRYKHRIYQSISDSYLGYITTQDPESTRFHACERFNRCPYVAVEDDLEHTKTTSTNGKRVIYVNPVNMDVARWAKYCEATKIEISSGKKIDHLLVPLFRHSTLPELQEFVRLFRPKSVVPNTLDPRLLNLDWACIDSLFFSCLHPAAKFDGSAFSRRIGIIKDKISPEVQRDEDVALKNLVGHGASKLAEKWADHGTIIKKLSTIREHISPEENAMMDVLLGKAQPQVDRGEAFDRSEIQVIDMIKGKGKQTVRSRYEERDSEDDTDNEFSDDGHARTAHIYFAESAGIDLNDKENFWWPTSEASQEQSEQDTGVPDEVVLTKGSGLGEPGVQDGAKRLNRLTPESSPNPTHRHIPRHSSTPTQVKTTFPGPAQMPSTSFHPQIWKSNPLTPSPKKGKAASGRSVESPICLVSSPVTPSKLKSSPKLHITPSSRDTAKSPTSSFPLSDKLSTPQENRMNSFSSPNPTRWGTYSQVPLSKHAAPLQNPTLTNTKRRVDDLSSSAKLKKVRTSMPEISTRKAHHLMDSSTNQMEVFLPGPSREFTPSAPSERQEVQSGRVKLAHELSENFHGLKAASFDKKQSRQLSRLDRKQKKQETPRETMSSCVPSTSFVKPLISAKTIACFEPVEDDSCTMDWNRSRQLADTVRNDAINGRRVVLPALRSSESQP